MKCKVDEQTQIFNFRNDARFARYNYQVKNLFCELLNIVIEKSKA